MYELFFLYEIGIDMEQWGSLCGRSESVYRTSVNYYVRFSYLFFQISLHIESVLSSSEVRCKLIPIAITND